MYMWNLKWSIYREKKIKNEIRNVEEIIELGEHFFLFIYWFFFKTIPEEGEMLLIFLKFVTT